MRSKLDCVPCFQQQALRAARAAGAPEDVQEQVLRSTIRSLAASKWDATPIDLGMPVHRTVRELTGVDDPFAAAKREATETALGLLPQLRERIEDADDPLHEAVRIATAGNIIDLGALETFDVEGTLERVSDEAFGIDDHAELRSELEPADSVLLFADNAGEIVFDRLLLETIHDLWEPRVTVVVKSGPFINDATIDDAQRSGYDELEWIHLREVSNGDRDDAPRYASAEIDEWIADHDATIAKGQANYEALSERSGLFFLLMAKCPCVAQAIGVEVGSIVLEKR